MTLPELIEDLRAALDAESWIGRMHYRMSGSGRSTKGGAAGDMGGIELGSVLPKERAVGWTGVPFTPQFERLLGSPDGWGSSYLARASVQEISDRCHARHVNHQRPGDRYGLCARLTFRVVEMAQPVSYAAERMGLELDVAESILDTALTYAADWRSNRFDDLRQAARVETSAATMPQEQFILDHDSTEWERQKWEGIREGYHLPPWEIEWERRMAQHAKYGCSRCERVKAA